MVTINDMTMVEAPLVLKSLVEEDAFAPANLMIPVSCEGEVPAAAQNMLTVLANTVEYGLASGLPQMLRIHNLMVLVSELVSTVETGALQMRAQGGAQLSAALVAQFSPQASEEVMTAVSEQRFTSPYTVEVLLGELASALSAAEDGEVIVPHLEAALHVYELLAILGGSDLAPAALCLVYQDEEAGVRAGLDWSRAAQVYGNEHDVADEVWEDEDTEGNDDDDLYAQFAADLGYGEQAAEDDYNEWVDLDDDEAR
jgi:3-hydroxyisobutyrate dehydrogenase